MKLLSINTAAAFLLMLLVPAGVVARQKGVDAAQKVGVVKAVAPLYPPVAEIAGVSGTVVVEVQVRGQGEVAAARSVAGFKLLAGAAERSAMRWVFEASKDEARTVRLIFTFTIVEDEAPVHELAPVFTLPYSIEVRAKKRRVVNVISPQESRFAPRRYGSGRRPRRRAATPRLLPRSHLPENSPIKRTERDRQR